MIQGFPMLAAAEKAAAAGRLDEAAQLALRHVRQNRGEPRGIALLGSVAMTMGALHSAESFFRQALSVDPNNRELRRSLAACLHQQERLDEALELLRSLAASGPANPDVEASIAMILDKLGRADESRLVLRQLAEAHPANVVHWISYGHNLRFAGQTDEAIAAYRRAIAIDPERGDAWWGIANIKRSVFDDDDVSAMQAALGTAIDNANLAPLNFALARAMHDRQRFEEAFRHYETANRIWAETLNYDPRQLSEEVSRSQILFDAAFFADEAGGDPSMAPIFIVSLPRSGSTLLEQMLDSHPAVEALGELPHIPALMRTMMEAATRHGITSVPDAIVGLSPSDRTAMGAEYLRRAGVHRKSEAPFFVDKMPHNWSNIAFIRQILPKARFIDIRREALDCCFSNFTHSFSRAHASSFALGDIGRSYVDYVRLMEHVDAVAPGRVHHLRYEALVGDPEPQLRRIMDYVGLPWDAAVLRFHESKRNVRTPSAEQVRRPLNREGMAAWKPYEKWLVPLRDALGPLAKG